MANLIKNALIKQLSKFLKNVSANQINISTFKGEGEMKNIQLDENVLMELIELPTWLKITNARCNKATFKVQWTKIKTTPIIIGLDKIEIDMEITENLREPFTGDSKLFDKDANGPYSLIDKCIDAIQLNIDSVTITIKSEKFNANLNMSNIYVYSCRPNWEVTNDIKNTRLKDLEKGEIILYKEISWEICRLECFILEPGLEASHQPPASIKLIMNPSKIQIALKKKLSDKSLINSTLRILLNEIYWMANDTQLKSAIGTYTTISKLMKKASLQQRKQVAAQQLSAQSNKPKTPSNVQSPNQTQNGLKNDKDDSKVFCQYDIKETSLHLQISVLNIHLYADENYSGNNLIDGGAMQILFKNLCIDHYPYHKTGYNTKHWNNYNHVFMQREDWSRALINDFIQRLQTILNKANITDLNQIKLKSTLTLLEACTIITLQDLCVYKVTTNVSNKAAAVSQKSKKSALKNPIESVQSEMPIFDELLKTKQFFIEQQTYNKQPFFGSNFIELGVPPDTLFMQFFFSDFYFSENCNYPIPCSQIFSHISPMLINVDYLTLLWVNTLLLSLYHEKLIVDESKKAENKSVKKPENGQSNKKASAPPSAPSSFQNQSFLNLDKHCDTHLELLMPKLVLAIMPLRIKSQKSSSTMLNGIELGFSSICLTNKSLSATGTDVKNDFVSACNKVYSSSKILCDKQSRFNEQISNAISLFDSIDPRLNNLAPCFKDLIHNENLSYMRHDLSSSTDLTKLVNTTNEAKNSKIGLFLKSLNRSALNKNARKDIWCIDFKSVWLDCCACDPIYKKTLIKNTSFRLWLANVHDFYKCNDIDLNQFNDINNPKQSKSYMSNLNQNLDQVYERLSKIIYIDNDPIRTDKPIQRSDFCNPISNSADKPIKKEKRSNSLASTKNMLKRQQTSRYLSSQLYSKMNIIGEIDKLEISCNHEQLVFLLRFLETFDLFNEQLATDSEHTLKYNKISTNDSNSNKDRNNNSNNKLILDLEHENLENEAADDSIDSPVLNLSLVINTINVDLEINNYNIDNEPIIEKNKDILPCPDPKFPEVIKKQNSDSLFDTTSFNIKIKDPMMKEVIVKEDFDAISKQLDQEFMSGYLKFIYGISMENPNLKLSFSNLPVDDQLQPQVMPKGLDLLGIEINNVKNASLSALSPNNMSYSFSAVSSQVTSNKVTQAISNKTVSFFNKPLSNINSVIKTVKTQAELIENEFFDDNDSNSITSQFSMMEQDNDTASLISFGTDFSLTTSSTSSLKLTERPNDLFLGLNTKSESVSSLNKNTPIDTKSNSSFNRFDSISDTNTETGIPVINETTISYTNSQAQTIQQTRIIKIKICNLQAYAQVNADSNIFALAGLDSINIDGKTSEYKKSKTNITSDGLNYPPPHKTNDNNKEVSKTSLNHEIIIQFKKKKGDPVCEEGLADIIIENLKLEIDVPTMNGIIDFIDDDGDESKGIKRSLPANIRINNSKFILNKFMTNEFDKFKNKIGIDHLYVQKSAFNEISIAEALKPINKKKSYSPMNVRLSVYSNINKKQQQRKSFEVDKEILIADYERKLAEKELKDKGDTQKSEQLASLVFHLRKSKEENRKIQIRLENEIYNAKLLEAERKEKEELTKKKKDTEPIGQYELERKQFESILKTYEGENEILKAKLKKSEDMITILNIERDCYSKKLNEQLKINKK